MSNWVAVLDIGSTKVACVIAERSGTVSPRPLGIGAVKCEGALSGFINDRELIAHAIKQAVSTAEQMAGLKAERLVVGAYGPLVTGLSSMGVVPIYPRTRAVTREDVLQVVNHSRQLSLTDGRELLQAIPREFRVDGQTKIQKPIGMVGGRLEVTTYLVTADSEQLQGIEECVKEAGYEIDQMVLGSMASGLSVLTNQEMDEGVAVVDIGDSGTELAIFQNRAISYSSSIPIGGALVTSDLSKLLKTSLEEANRLKTEFGAAWSKSISEQETISVVQLGQIQARPMQRRVLCEIIESRMRELALFVRKEIEESGFSRSLSAGIALTGGGSRLIGSETVFEEQMKHLKVRQGRPKSVGPMAQQADRPELAMAVGMARFALDANQDELAPATGSGDWKERIRTLWSLVGGRH